jgi:hypothetical protein
MGYYALRQSAGSHNSALGDHSLYLSPGSHNSALGFNSLYSSPGSFNIALGDYALYQSTGSYNSAVGYYAGYLGGGVSNLFLGYYAGYSAGLRTNCTVLGAGAPTRGDYTTSIGPAGDTYAIYLNSKALFPTNTAAPAGVAGCAGLYALDGGGANAELWAYDSDGNDTQLTTHDGDTAIHYSHNKLSGRWRRIDLDAQGEGKPPSEYYTSGWRKPVHMWADWQETAQQERERERAAWTRSKQEYDEWQPDLEQPDMQRPPDPGAELSAYVLQPEPDWLVTRLRDDNPHTSATAWTQLSAADQVGIPRPAADAWRQYIRVRQIDE